VPHYDVRILPDEDDNDLDKEPDEVEDADRLE